jgi:hypothetical protein
MKWYLPFLCVWAISAQAQTTAEPLVFEVPMLITCTDVPTQDLLKKQYGEVPFVAGDSVLQLADGTVLTGKMQIYVDLKGKRSYTIIVTINGLDCLVLSGENIKPTFDKDGAI